jgi:hypothetical protein
VLGVNPHYGYAHYNRNCGAAMKERYTQDKDWDVMHKANRFGINGLNCVHLDRGAQDCQRFVAEGGKMHLLIQVTAGLAAEMVVKTLKPLALQRQGEVVDTAYQNGEIVSAKRWRKMARDLGVMVGMGTQIPEVVAQIESENWGIDFFSGCGDNRRRTEEEWKEALTGETSDPPGGFPIGELGNLSAQLSKASSSPAGFTWACSRTSRTRSAKTRTSSFAISSGPAESVGPEASRTPRQHGEPSTYAWRQAPFRLLASGKPDDR